MPRLDRPTRTAACLPPCIAALLSFVAGSAAPVSSQPIAQPATWQVDRVPLLRLSAAAEGRRTNFGVAAWATRLGSDEIAVADGADRRIRIFGMDGIERRAFGRDGRGPAEFQSIGWIGSCGTDSLFAWDIVRSGMSVWHPRTGYERAWSAPALRGPMRAVCSTRPEFAFPARMRRSAQSRPIVSASTPSGVRYRIYVDTFDVQTLDATGAELHAIDAGIRGESVSGNLPGGRFASMDRPLGLQTFVAVVEGRIVLAATDSGWVRVFDRNGVETASFRIAPSGHAVTRAERDAGVVAFLRRTPGVAVEVFGELGRAIPLPERAPAFHDLAVSADGLLWFVLSGPDAKETVLAVHRVDGTRLATVRIPEPVAVFEVGRDFVLGSVENDDGEQEVVLYRVRPS